MAETDREKIKAELQMSERDKTVANLRRLIADFDEWQAALEERERELGLPTFYRSKPIPERLMHVGFDKDTIDRVVQLLDAIQGVAKGEPPPEFLVKEMAEETEAEQSALEQLGAIVERRAK